MLITKIKLANLVTYMGIAFATSAIYFAFNNHTKWAFICFMLSGICDMFDGMFARRFERTPREKEIGIQMDSLADVISFLVVPVTLFISAGMTSWYDYIVYTIYVMLGITRLAFFNVYAAENKGKILRVYRGLAVTFSSFVFPIAYAALSFAPKKVAEIVLIVLMLIISWLFVWDIPVPKPSKKGYMFFSIMGIIMLGIYIFIL